MRQTGGGVRVCCEHISGAPIFGFHDRGGNSDVRPISLHFAGSSGHGRRSIAVGPGPDSRLGRGVPPAADHDHAASVAGRQRSGVETPADQPEQSAQPRPSKAAGKGGGVRRPACKHRRLSPIRSARRRRRPWARRWIKAATRGCRGTSITTDRAALDVVWAVGAARAADRTRRFLDDSAPVR